MGVSSAQAETKTMTRLDDIITNFELQVDDRTELSTAEEKYIAQRVYQRVCIGNYEFLKKPATGSILNDATGYYITIPSDFLNFAENSDYSQNYLSEDEGLKKRVIYVGTNYTKYQIINYSDRLQYRTASGYCYFDFANGVIRFTAAPILSDGLTYAFDYYGIPTTLLTSLAPAWPSIFDDIIVYGMAVDNDVLQKSEKARSYARENQAYFKDRINDLKLYNARLLNYGN